MTTYQDSRYKCGYGCGSTCTVQDDIDFSNWVNIFCPHCRKTTLRPKLPKPIQPPSQEMKLPSDVAQAILDRLLQEQEKSRMADVDYIKKGTEVAEIIKGVFAVQETIDEEGAMEVATWLGKLVDPPIPSGGMTKFTIGFFRGLRTKKNELLLAEKSQVVESD